MGGQLGAADLKPILKVVGHECKASTVEDLSRGLDVEAFSKLVNEHGGQTQPRELVDQLLFGQCRGRTNEGQCAAEGSDGGVASNTIGADELVAGLTKLGLEATTGE